jgi:isopenicillin N synthase-like dioxygenase
MIKSFDLKDIQDNSKELVQSLKEIGFAVITNHGISENILLTFYKEWEKFFNSSQDFKNIYHFKELEQTGYFPFGLEKAKGSTTADLKEFYHFYLNRAKDPTDGITSYLYHRMNGLGTHLLALIELGLPEEVKSELSESLISMVENTDQTLFRIIHYPAIKDSSNTTGVRAAAHEDINLITLLPMATAEGLEVLDAQGNWLKVGGDPNAIVINVGDMLQEATKGYLRSTTHRVVNTNMNKARYSAPLFIHPKPQVKLSDIYTADSYLQERLKELGLKK